MARIIKTPFFYKYGEVETNKPWVFPIPIEKFNNWFHAFEDNLMSDLQPYNVYLGGKYVIDPLKTKDVDICLTGPILDYDVLYKILKTGLDLALNNFGIYVDIKHYDNIDFFKYPRHKDFVRLHQVTEMAGEQMQIVNDVVLFTDEKPTTIIHKSIPKEIAVNMQEIPYTKQIADGRIYDPIKLRSSSYGTMPKTSA